MSRNQWFHGLAAAFIGGMAGAIDSGLALCLVAPESFNLSAGLRKTLITVAVLGCLTGVKCAFAYLRQAPLPDEVEDQKKVAAAGSTH